MQEMYESHEISKLTSNMATPYLHPTLPLAHYQAEHTEVPFWFIE